MKSSSKRPPPSIICCTNRSPNNNYPFSCPMGSIPSSQNSVFLWKNQHNSQSKLLSYISEFPSKSLPVLDISYSWKFESRAFSIPCAMLFEYTKNSSLFFLETVSFSASYPNYSPQYWDVSSRNWKFHHTHHLRIEVLQWVTLVEVKSLKNQLNSQTNADIS